MAKPVISVTRSAARHLRRGHPWVWERGVDTVRGEPAAGDAVRIVSGPKRTSLGFGFYDPKSPIRARVVGAGSPPSREWAADLAERAVNLRQSAAQLESTDAMRLLHGEADGTAGLVIDRYGPVATVRFDGRAAELFWRPFLEVMFERFAALGVRTLFIRGEGAVVGEAPPEPLIIFEDRARFEVDLERGQKTGLFLDQRPNRRRVAELAAGKRVLNLCSYTGGFSVHAALGGATEVVTVDSAKPAIEAAERNFGHSSLEAAEHEFECVDVFDFLAEKRNARAFDLVVCDPPSFAPRRSAVSKAMRAYTALNKLAISAVCKRGILVTASCSSHINHEMFAEVVADGATRARRDAVVFQTGGPGCDHPSRPGFPEGDYLKVLYLYSP